MQINIANITETTKLILKVKLIRSGSGKKPCLPVISVEGEINIFITDRHRAVKNDTFIRLVSHLPEVFVIYAENNNSAGGIKNIPILKR